MNRFRIIPVACASLCFAVVAVTAAEHPTQTGPPRRLLLADYQKKRIALVDAKNQVVWEHSIQAIHDAHVLEDGNILFQTSFQNVVEMTPAGKTVWKYEATPTKGDRKRVEIHAFQRLNDGVTMIAESGPGRIIEVDKKGRIVHEVKLTVIVNCHAGPKNPQMLEVTPEKEIVWRFRDFERFGNSLPVGVVIVD